MDDKEKKTAKTEDTKDEAVKGEKETAKTEEKPKENAKTEDKKDSKKSGKDEKVKSEEKKPEEKPVDEKDKYLRLMAEYDNFRKRSQREKDSLYADIKSDTVTKFLPVYDNLVRALAQSTDDEAYRKGVEMIMNQFNATLEKLGVTEIEALGAKFDPSLHNAVMHVDDEEKGENEIVDVFQKGFMLGDKVIRFAMVKVAN